MQNSITIKELLDIIDSREYFYNIKLFKANIATKKAGEYIVITKAKVAHNQSISEPKQVISKNSSANKNHNQNLNFTRNIELPNKSIITIHPILVREINGYKLL